MDLSEDFILNLDKFSLNKLQKDIVLGISGGVDSIVLAHLFIENKIPISLCHINFNLRGEESDQDMGFVSEFADRHGLRLYTKSVDTVEYSRGLNASIQMAAREIRYSFFREVCHEYHLNHIATAHHLNDCIESFIFNSSKGTGIKGLVGMRYLTKLGDLNLIRPLVNVSKDDILAYAHSKNITWREDSSNNSTYYSRNKIRHNIIPILKGINPNLEKSFLRTLERIGLVASVINREISDLYAKCQTVDNDVIEIDISKISDKNLSQLFIIDIMTKYGFSYLIYDQIFTSLGKIGSRFLSDKWQMNIDNYRLFIFPKDLLSNSEGIIVEEKESFRLRMYDKIIINFDKINIKDVNYDIPSVTYLDYDKISWPITIRHPQIGDKFIPLGMNSYKKLSDFFIDSKVPKHKRKGQLIIENSKNNIIAIVGMRPSDICKVDSTTSRVSKIWSTMD